MWNAAYSHSLSIVTLVIASLFGLMSISRQKRTLGVFSSSFLLISLAFFLFPLREPVPAFARHVLPHLCLMLSYLFLAWGARAFYRKEPAWPLRFWFYPSILAGIILFSLIARSDFRLRVICTTLMICLVSIEFLQGVSRTDFSRINATIRIPIIVLINIFIITNIVRIALILALSIGTHEYLEPHWLTTFTILNTLVFTIIWSGVIVILDVERLLTRMEEKNAQLEHIALKDRLTGVLNRYSLESILDTELERQDRYLESLSFILLDIDHFKQVNDTWGHEMGDKVLIMVANLVNDEIRSSDRLFRWGGEEFLIVVPHTDCVGANGLAEKLRLKVAFADLSGFGKTDPEFGGVTISLGVTERMPGESRDDCFRRVDSAMYRAKNNGRNRVEAAHSENKVDNHIVVEWKQEWESGLKEIDDEHRGLIQRGNRLLNLSITTHSPQLLIQAMDSFEQYIRIHFRNEEQLLASIQYPKLAEHRKCHEKLLNETDKMRKQITRGIVDPSALFHFLVDKVLVAHMLDDDADFFPFARQFALGERQA